MPNSDSPPGIAEPQIAVSGDKIELNWKMTVKNGAIVFRFNVLQVWLYCLKPFPVLGEPTLIHPPLSRVQYTRSWGGTIGGGGLSGSTGRQITREAFRPGAPTEPTGERYVYYPLELHLRAVPLTTNDGTVAARVEWPIEDSAMKDRIICWASFGYIVPSPGTTVGKYEQVAKTHVVHHSPATIRELPSDNNFDMEFRQLVLRLERAKQELLSAATERECRRIEQDIMRLETDIAHQQQIIAQPDEMAHRTQALISAGIERERHISYSQVDTATRVKKIGRPPASPPPYFQNRHQETRDLIAFLNNEAKRVLVVHGRAGIGKTILVLRLLKSLEQGKLPDDLGEMNLDSIIYLNMAEVSSGVAPGLFESLAKLASEENQEQLTEPLHSQEDNIDIKVRTLLDVLALERVVVLLDNFEDALDTADEIANHNLDETLRVLLSAPQHAVKVIITTRVKPQSLMLDHPTQQDLLDIRKGLEFPYAEELIRARDEDGVLGLKSLPTTHPLLGEARERTRGHPRALEILVSILKIDRNASLQDVLEDLRRREEQITPSLCSTEYVIEALIGDAYSRLDLFAQQVIQALSVYNRPVPAVALDFLLQPYRPSVDTAPILRRLVNMNLVHRESERYYLHPFDRAYVFGLIAPGTSEDRVSGDSRPFTQIALSRRAAEFSRRTRRPPREWKSIHDLEPQLAEIELRIAAGDYDLAAEVLQEIEKDYLYNWGHLRVLLDLYERLLVEVRDPSWKLHIADNLGSIYLDLGHIAEAMVLFNEALTIARDQQDRTEENLALGRIGWAHFHQGRYDISEDLIQQALQISREIGVRSQTSHCLGMLGSLQLTLGHPEAALTYYKEALRIARELREEEAEVVWQGHVGHAHYRLGQIHLAGQEYEHALAVAEARGSRRWQSAWMSSLANIHHMFGRMKQAIELNQAALSIARDLDIPSYKSTFLCNLGLAYDDLGQHDLSITHYKEALAIDRDLQSPYEIAHHSCNFGNALIHVGQWDEAEERFSEALDIADKIGASDIQNCARAELAFCRFFADNIASAMALIAETEHFNCPSFDYFVITLKGLIMLHNDDETEAKKAFTAALMECNRLLGFAEDNYDVLDIKALALCGLTLCEDQVYLRDAVQAFRKARSIMAGDGHVKRILQLFDALAVIDEQNLLASARVEIEGA